MLWIVLPTRNEEAIIAQNLDRLLAFCRETFSGEDWRVIVADNASTDATRAIVRRVTEREPSIELLTFDQPGKGGAVLGAWRYCERRRGGAPSPPATEVRVSTSTNAGGDGAPPLRHIDAYAFLDADLATDLHHLPELVAAVRDGADIAATSRYLPDSRVTRSIFRTLVSRANRLLLRARFMLRMTDPPCGMKAVSEQVVRDIAPLIRDTQWFFDTEICIRAQRAGMRIVELPVTWHEPRITRGSIRKVLRITRANLRAMHNV